MLFYFRSNQAVEAASVVQSIESVSLEATKDKSQLEQPIESSNRDAKVASSSVHNRLSGVENACSVVESLHEQILNLGLDDDLRKSLECNQQSLNQIQGLFFFS